MSEIVGCLAWGGSPEGECFRTCAWSVRVRLCIHGVFVTLEATHQSITLSRVLCALFTL